MLFPAVYGRGGCELRDFQQSKTIEGYRELDEEKGRKEETEGGRTYRYLVPWRDKDRVAPPSRLVCTYPRYLGWLSVSLVFVNTPILSQRHGHVNHLCPHQRNGCLLVHPNPGCGGASNFGTTMAGTLTWPFARVTAEQGTPTHAS